MIGLKATANFEAAANKLTIAGELLPPDELQHHMLAALLDEKNPPEVNVEFQMVNNVLTFAVVFKHESDIAVAGKEAHDLTVDARNAGMSVEELVSRREAAAKAQKAAEKENGKAAAAQGNQSVSAT